MILQPLILVQIQLLRHHLFEILTISTNWAFLVSSAFKSLKLTNLQLDKFNNWKIWLNLPPLLSMQSLELNRQLISQTWNHILQTCSTKVILITSVLSIASSNQPKPLSLEHLLKKCLLIQLLNKPTLKMLTICNWLKNRQWAKLLKWCNKNKTKMKRIMHSHQQLKNLTR